MADAEHTLHVLNRLFAMGVYISIDDYGTGYASLFYLKQLPADELKIDRAFVQYVTTDQADQAIVRSTVSMAHSLGMQVVAEGVEDQATWNLLASLKCDIAQGYNLSRPESGALAGCQERRNCTRAGREKRSDCALSASQLIVRNPYQIILRVLCCRYQNGIERMICIFDIGTMLSKRW